MQSIAPADGRVRRESYHGQRGPSRLGINKGVNRRAIRNIPSPAPAPTDSKKNATKRRRYHNRRPVSPWQSSEGDKSARSHVGESLGETATLTPCR